jgi:pimeloyl-ACP methyl ester carboxylesterase
VPARPRELCTCWQQPSRRSANGFNAAGKAWLKRIAARKLDREPEAKPQVAEAQLVALAKWGAIPATDRYGDLKKIKQRTLVVNGNDDIMVPTINSYILQQQLPDARLILYPDSGHGSQFQFSEEFAALRYAFDVA